MPPETAAATPAAPENPVEKGDNKAKRPMPVWATVLTTLVSTILTAAVPLGYAYLDLHKEQKKTEVEAAEIKRKADKAYRVTAPAVNQLIKYSQEDHKTLAGYGKDLDLLWALLHAKGWLPAVRPSERIKALAAAMADTDHAAGVLVASTERAEDAAAYMDTRDTLEDAPAPAAAVRPRSRPRPRPRPRPRHPRVGRVAHRPAAAGALRAPKPPDARAPAPDAGPPKEKPRAPIKPLPDKLMQQSL